MPGTITLWVGNRTEIITKHYINPSGSCLLDALSNVELGKRKLIKDEKKIWNGTFIASGYNWTFPTRKVTVERGWKNPAWHEEGKLGEIINYLLIQELGDIKYN